MLNPWLGMCLVVSMFAVQMVGLGAYRRSHPMDPELVRKLLHIGMGLVTLSLPWLFATAWPVLLLTVAFTLFLTSLRLSRRLQQLLGGVIDGVARQSIGEIYFPVAVGSLFLLSGGDPLLYSTPLLILALADAAAALIGKRYGRLRYATVDGEKSIEGSVAFLIVAFLCVQIMVNALADRGHAESLVIAATAALILTLVEAIAWRGLDNLLVPLAAFLLLKIFLGMDAAALGALLAVAVTVATFSLIFCRLRVVSPPERSKLFRVDSGLLTGAGRGQGIWSA